jgi:hypothetical protein
MKKYKKQIKWRQNKVQELLTRGYSQQETSSALHISPRQYQGISFIKNNIQKGDDANDTKAKPAEDFFIGKMSFDEIKKNLWEIVDNKKNTKELANIKSIKTTG